MPMVNDGKPGGKKMLAVILNTPIKTVKMVMTVKAVWDFIFTFL